jgi:septum formation protein
MNTNRSVPVVLASSSPFRKELLQRLGITFTTVTPEVNEAPLADETPDALVRRLAEAKARAVAQHCKGLIIGSDQLATTGSDILGKPGTHARAAEQLHDLSGQLVTFHTGLCLLDSSSGAAQVDVIPFRVKFRQLDEEQIARYLQADQPYNCAGSFKSEGLGITLFEYMDGADPTALIGLPLICLTTMFARAGLVLP